MGKFAETANVNNRYRWSTKEHKHPFSAPLEEKYPSSSSIISSDCREISSPGDFLPPHTLGNLSCFYTL